MTTNKNQNMNQQEVISQSQWIIDQHKIPEEKKKKSFLTDEQLQIEYKSVKQENDKLKSLILKIKQEIDVYSRMLTRNSSYTSSSLKISNMDSLLISTKRRKVHMNMMRSDLSSTTPTLGSDVMLNGGNYQEDINTEDLVLMNRLTDVLQNME